MSEALAVTAADHAESVAQLARQQASRDFEALVSPALDWAAKMQAWRSGWAHALRHGDPGGRLQLWRHAVAARILQQDIGVARALELADALILDRLAAHRPPPAGFWPVTLDGRHRFQPLDTLEKRGRGPVALLWPVLDFTGTLPVAVDLLAFDRADAGAWRVLGGLADVLVWDPSGLREARVEDGAPLRLYRAPRAWLEAVQEPPGEDGGAAAPLAACVLDPRSGRALRLLANAGELRCDDLAHGEQVKRWLGELLPMPQRPPVLVPRNSEGKAA